MMFYQSWEQGEEENGRVTGLWNGKGNGNGKVAGLWRLLLNILPFLSVHSSSPIKREIPLSLTLNFHCLFDLLWPMENGRNDTASSGSRL